jgi:DNA-binding response OmpR family regulator
MGSELAPKACILVVDDEDTILRLLQKHLERHGYDVLVAEDGETALRILAEDGERIDLVILDMIMPQMNGLSVLTELRRELPELPVLVASGYNQDIDRARAESFGVQGFLGKPFSLRDLMALVRSTLADSADIPPPS